MQVQLEYTRVPALVFVRILNRELPLAESLLVPQLNRHEVVLLKPLARVVRASRVKNGSFSAQWRLKDHAKIATTNITEVTG